MPGGCQVRVRSCTKPTTSPPIGSCQRRTSRPSAIRTDTGCDAAPNASAASRVSSQPDCQATVRNKIVRWPRRLGIPGGRDGRGGRLRTTPPLRRPRPTSTRPTKIPTPDARPSGRPSQFPALRHHPGQNLRRRPTRPPNRKPGWRRPPAVVKICFAFWPFLETRGLWSSFFYLMLHIVRKRDPIGAHPDARKGKVQVYGTVLRWPVRHLGAPRLHGGVLRFATKGHPPVGG